MASCDELPSGSDASLSCPSASDLHVDMSSSTLALLAASDLPSSSHGDANNVATTALHLERYASELLLFLQPSDASALADDALFFFETHHPELLDDLPLLFAWLSLFLAQQLDASDVDASLVAARAMRALDTSQDMAAVAEQFALKSALTLLFWRHEAERDKSDGGRPRPFAEHKRLLQWLLAHGQVPLTRQDVINHILDEYPVFAASKSPAALKVWVARFLKKHLPPNFVEPAEVEVGATGDELLSVQDKANLTTEVSGTALMPIEEEEEAVEVQRSGKRRSAPARYMNFSNEFKLQAVNMLDEGKSVAQVAEELGLKNPNCLSYWKSIRDKLVTSERKRFRLAGGGRRSSCSFEDELLTWVSERHQRGEGTDVKSVLEYMKEYHSSFTEGKKEPTLRKWILRFFKRCWRAPSTSMDSQDAEKSYIFV